MASSALQGKAFHLFLNLSFLLLLLFFSTTYLYSSHPLLRSPANSSPIHSANNSSEGCSGLHHFEGFIAKCAYIVFETQCNPEGYINYLYIFYCICGNYPIFGYAILLLWLVLLFYLSGNTAANYFCSSLEGLSKLLRLSPTIAGVTLLSLGNGAPDVFSSIVSFMGTNSSDLVGLNSVLGGAFFVSSVIVGIISVCIAPRKISIDKCGFIRDLCFLLFVLLVLLAILVVGRINVWSAMAFTSLYFAYIFLVSFTHVFAKGQEGSSLLPIKGDLEAPLLENVAKISDGGKPRKCYYFCGKILCFLELPLYLPRRLTIPDVSEERWSKPFAVSSVTLAPILLAALCESKREELGYEGSFIIYIFAGFSGILLGIAVMLKTEKERPPTRFLFIWLAGGFLMSVTWTYIIAEELVSLLVSLGVILRISPSVLGLTVLAWGNSLGDLIANVAVAVNGGSSGAQVAISGCFGGPIFNTLVGLGLSLVISSWSHYPASMAISKDSTLFETLGFLIAGLLWSLVMLPKRGMTLDRVLGFGLFAIYLCFLSLRIGQSLWLVPLQ